MYRWALCIFCSTTLYFTVTASAHAYYISVAYAPAVLLMYHNASAHPCTIGIIGLDDGTSETPYKNAFIVLKTRKIACKM